MATITFTGEALPLSAWRALARGAGLSLAPDVYARVDEGAAIVAAIVKKGDAVYGINTGFGKLANVRIADSDLETLQRNLVLSHAAGVGDPVPCPHRAADDGAEARQSRPRRLGRAPRDLAASARHAGGQRDPGGPGAGLGRRVRRSGAAGASHRGDDRRRRRASMAASACRRSMRSAAPGWSRWCSGRRKAWRCSTARNSRPRMRLARLFDIERVFQSALVTGALVDRCRARLRHAVRSRASRRCAAIAARSTWRPRLRTLMDGSAHPRLASHHRRPHPGSRIACAASRR